MDLPLIAAPKHTSLFRPPSLPCQVAYIGTYCSVVDFLYYLSAYCIPQLSTYLTTELAS